MTLGFNEHEAKVIEFLLKTDSSNQRDIERACDMRQPVVSITLSSLKKLGIVTFVEVSDGRAARPNKVYSIIRRMIIKDKVEAANLEYELKCEAISEVEKFIHDNI